MIEDLSVDKELEAAEKKEAEEKSMEKQTGIGSGGPAGIPQGLLGLMNPFGAMGAGPMTSEMDFAGASSSYVEEKTDADGHHTTKKVTKGDGWEQVEISSDGPLDIGSLIG